MLWLLVPAHVNLEQAVVEVLPRPNRERWPAYFRGEGLGRHGIRDGVYFQPPRQLFEEVVVRGVVLVQLRVVVRVRSGPI